MASIQKRGPRKNGSFSYQVQWRDRDTRKPERWTFETADEAEMWKRLLDANGQSLKQAEKLAADNKLAGPTVAELMATHISELTDVGPYMLKRYKKAIGNHFSGPIGMRKAAAVEYEDIVRWIKDMQGKDLAPKTIANWHGFLSATMTTASIATSNPTNPRIDVAYLAIQDSQYAGTTNTAVLGIATGVPTAGAAYPANAPTIPANAIALAWINVPANASSILNANITAISNRILTPSAVAPAAGAGWTLTGTLNRVPTSNGTQVQASIKAIYAGAGSFTVNGTFISAFTLSNTGYIPAAGFDAYGYFMLRAAGTRAVKADCCFTIDNTGAVYVRTLLGQAATTFAIGDEMAIETVWNV